MLNQTLWSFTGWVGSWVDLPPQNPMDDHRFVGQFWEYLSFLAQPQINLGEL